MWETIVGILLSAVAFFIGAKILSGVEIKNFGRAIIIAIIIAFLNATVGWVLDKVFGIIDWVTFGLFQFVIDAIVIWIADKITKDFYVKNFLNAIFLAIIVSVLTSFGVSLFQ